MRCEEAQELITGLTDNELSADERRAVEAHLGACRACQAAHAVEIELKKRTRAAATVVNAGGDLKQKLSTLVDYATKYRPAHPTVPLHWWSTPRWRLAFASIALVLFVLPFLYFGREPDNLIAPAIFETYRKVLADQMTYVQSENADELERQLVRAVDGRFKPMGYDLGMLKVKPANGAVQEIGARKVLVVVYRGDGPEVICFTFLGSEDDAPREAKLFYDPEKKMNFHTFSQDGVNAVMHREDDVICVLVSKLPMDDLLTVARAKARHA
jgi:hypothetical protein